MIRPSGRLQALQNDILEDIARGEPLAACMERLCHRAEAISPGVICSVVTVDDQGCLQPLASPSLPAHFANSIAGAPVGPSAGSCGTAIHRGQPVEVTDIATDPLWASYTGLVLPLGLRACWSTPIKARDGRVIGAFAFYFTRPRSAQLLERQIVATCVHLCAIAIEHDEVRTRNHRLAYFDTLTGLPNRSRFNSAIAEMSVAGGRYGLMLIDIDHLKLVNDTLGHAAGDALIAEVGTRLGAALAGCLTCRIGGDEFAVLIPDCAEPARMRSLASAATAAMAHPLDHDGHSVVPSVTIGGAIAGEDGQDSVTLRQNADLALYHAKETRRGRYVRFRRQLRSAMMQRIRVRRAVDGALGDERIIPYYQPVIRLDTTEIVGLEALARMRLDDGRIVTAGEFQDALRDPKIAHRTTTQMLTAVAADMAEWRAGGLNFQHVAVNVTSADFQKGDLVQRAARILEKAAVPMQQLAIEVTEQVFMGGRKDGVARTMEALRACGSPVALDDFGTGFASLTHLLDFPIDIIKIDRSFVASIDSGARSEIIIEALLTMTRRLGMKIVAEGIETQGQAERLTGMGCRLGQGYLYSPPVPASIIREWLLRFAQPAPPPGLVANAA
ncbi:MAG: EAL domain-containing protein [Bosea sp.]|uniref:putative bifunctional diguanylate cyclase/phosphodiesterase n=1 Tax=Bosea sp. (in: a-proteobacteria) TaxID=1871050 RepID=UPI001AC16E74|nr:EAL domain-containing protein [Bosea sp. (in: a-proteobacteria)]MBN9451896.1 EAL domain-containing protein [Bosea sp. (in: a-proteobacteria)]